MLMLSINCLLLVIVLIVRVCLVSSAVRCSGASSMLVSSLICLFIVVVVVRYVSGLRLGYVSWFSMVSVEKLVWSVRRVYLMMLLCVILGMVDGSLILIFI